MSWAPRSGWTRRSRAAAVAAPERAEHENRAGRGLNVSSSQSARARVNPQRLGRRKHAYTLYTYAVNELWLYFGLMLALAVLPNIIVQAFSLSWQIADECRPWGLVWLTNLLLFGTLHRQWLTLRACFYADKTKQPRDYNAYTQHNSDLCLLDLYKSFLKSAPQLVLQTYIWYDTKDWRPQTG
ncbi:hypothetical protein HPB49_017053 [Dermacentor silvarum]|uniref:Uncharacterized protein n=1 Tax=Dermacentor silvarum TaxID=543639 RepID=A0ACB8DPW8_DERSI|nr:hypothetical protein HPB49_017053 [Dermacentor silvarum]